MPFSDAVVPETYPLFTSAMIDQDFADYQNEAKIKPNPSNQNFYSKLIKALNKKGINTYYDFDIISFGE